MISGGCPYCDAGIHLFLPEGVRLPVFNKETCEECGKQFWEYYSRVDPCAYTVEDFNERFIIDEEARAIRTR